MIDVLAADPPWLFDDPLPGKRGAVHKYPCLSLAQLVAFPLPPLGPNAVLFLWRCAAMQLEALQLAAAWGFCTKAELVWEKVTTNGKHHFGTGRYVRGSHETCLIATRGRAWPEVRNVRSSFAARMPVNAHGRIEHSAKPDEFYWIVERMYSRSQRYELFARTRREGWTQFGNQLPAAPVKGLRDVRRDLGATPNSGADRPSGQGSAHRKRGTHV